ncbi:MAG: hypothetical protein A3G36_03225 [Omnitrophica bacterium RIFCSPLOWO2_12_FULL_45_13]|nr:MAG: hypothetical protein A3G36_03225 [Omnitrophica bacterium RIFCSPLOWO2_12_FULL_45_13]
MAKKLIIFSSLGEENSADAKNSHKNTLIQRNRYVIFCFSLLFLKYTNRPNNKVNNEIIKGGIEKTFIFIL